MKHRQFSPALPDFVSFVALGPGDEDAASLLPAEELLVHPRAIASRRADFRLGRAAGRRAMERFGYGSTPILQGASREPLWPDGLVGSITHADGYALAAVCERDQAGGLGLDLEHIGRSFDSLGGEVAFGDESLWLETLSHDQKASAMLEIFSAKECIYKAFYPRVGRWFGFEAAQVFRLPGGDYEARLLIDLDPEFPPGRSFSIACQWRGDLVLTSLLLSP